MRPAPRLALAAVTALAVLLPLAGPASARPEPAPVPSESQVDRARAEVATTKEKVAAMEAALASANARLQQAALAASVAAEAHNGAVYRLAEARRAYRGALLSQERARANVTAQREGIVSLVTDSYQNGTDVSSATVMLSDEGPTGLMNRYGVVESAGDSMEARYERFRTASARAATFTSRAADARERQEGLAEEARALRDAAGSAANAAAIAAGEIAVQRDALIRALAEAQDISVELAGKRQRAMERIAAQRAVAAARARAAAEREAVEAAEKAADRAAAKADQKADQAAKQAEEARKDQKQAEKDGAGVPSGTTGGHTATGPAVDTNPPAPGNGAQRAIAYAKAQLGKPYEWGAAGPGSFDCSGLTLMAWRAGGKSLPHWSVAQFQQSTPISVGSLRPGDLVFWGSTPGTIHHVAMYIGDGQIIHAPRTGQPVQISSMYYWVPPDFFARP